MTRRRRMPATVVPGLTVTGVVLGGVWGWIAPPIHAVVALTRAGDRVHDYLGAESQHFFDAPALMLGLLTVVASVAPVLVWQWHKYRGPGLVVALSLGMVACAAAAAAVGVAVVRLRYGALNFDAVPLSDDHKFAYVVEAPPVFFAQSPWQVVMTLIWPVAITALVCAVMAAGSARDDLGAVAAADDEPSSPSGPMPMEPQASVP